eukprot:1048792-Pelagomonas_calceolata.AAC.5
MLAHAVQKSSIHLVYHERYTVSISKQVQGMLAQCIHIPPKMLKSKPPVLYDTNHPPWDSITLHPFMSAHYGPNKQHTDTHTHKSDLLANIHPHQAYAIGQEKSSTNTRGS